MQHRIAHIALNLQKYSPDIQLGESSMIRYLAISEGDCIGEGKAMAAYGLPVIFALPSHGKSLDVIALEKRTAILKSAANHFDWVELEADIDLHPQLLGSIPPEKRIIAWSGPALPYKELKEVLDRITSIPAHRYIIAPEANNAFDALPPLRLLAEAKRHDLIAFASGELGRWSRIASPFLGAPLVFSDPQSQASGAPTPSTWSVDYGLPQVRKIQKVFGIAGNPVFKSLSPRLHNKSYRQAELPFLYLPFHVANYQDFWKVVASKAILEHTGWEVGGITTVSPFKDEAYRAVSLTHNPYVPQTEACNLVLNRDGLWWADSTDGYGVTLALESLNHSPVGQTVAVIGCGGAGRAIAARLADQGATVHMVNRSRKRGEMAAQQLGLRFIPLADFHPAGYQIIVHATPQGKEQNEALIDLELADPQTLVIDLTYTKIHTPLIKKARDLGFPTVDGKEILVYQVREQYLRMTGMEMSVDLARSYAGIMKVKIG